MASKVLRTFGKFQHATCLEKGPAALLPESYKKFYREWKLTTPTAVHYTPEDGRWKRNEVTGEVSPVQNIPIPVFFPKESDDQLWGGEGVVQGFQQRSHLSRRVPHFWIPMLKRSVVYSEVLDKYISVVVTDRALRLINAHYGFDHYILKTPACDLQSLLAVSLKRKILQDLQNGCPSYAERPDKQKDVLDQYKKYLDAYTPEEIEWYGYSLAQAVSKFKVQQEKEKEESTVPFKQIFRAQLIEKLKAASLDESNNQMKELEEGNSATSWLSKINPFSKKQET
ncbi:unnamed protein product [Phyllotreta striolata]|uniref:Large ribosomal subunit protein bL28m n=1 Tax=Phyllotreta striolata TaxID=444603 RepID=A0A9N9TRY1_PHYSR|nr:unnamed protein product [Phyllotreta striolata]